MVSNLNLYPIGVSSQPRKKQNSLAKAQTLPLQTSRDFEPCSLHAHKAYAQVKFGSRLVDHRSWGAAVQKTGDINFKLFSWPDAKKVFVQIADKMDPKAWAHEHGDLHVKKDHKGEIKTISSNLANSKMFKLKKVGNGVFERQALSKFAKDGQSYRFVIVKADNSIVTVKDPYAMKQPHVLGWSKVYDHNKYQWKDKAWMDGKVKERFSRKHYENGLSNPYHMRLYEINIATLTKDGTFESAKKELARIKKDGFNAIHIMPVENTPGVNWGYDGVDKFAPSTVLGGPDKLKEFIDAAHEHKLNVVMDMVPNHIGPDGNFLGQTGPYSGGAGPFGDFFNYEGEHSENVQEFIANAALNWIDNYHVDGIRFDMTKDIYMRSDRALKKITSECHYHHPDVFLIAEDGRENDPRITRPLHPHEEKFATEDDHVAYTQKIARKDLSLSLDNIGFDSEWDFPYQKQIAQAVLGHWEGKPRNLYHLDGAIRGSRHRQKHPMTHDEEGNMDGITLGTRFVSDNLGLFFKMEGKSDCEKGQRAAHFAQKLCVAEVTGRADTMSKYDYYHWNRFLQKNHLKEIIPVETLKGAVANSLRANKLATGVTYAAEGPKMIFQGNERGSFRYFKFFREMLTPDDVVAETAKKGYAPGRQAFLDSKLDSIKPSPKYEEIMDGQERYVAKLNEMVDKVPAMNDGEIVSSIIHDRSDVYALHRKKDDSEVFAVSNFSGFGYDGNYGIHFPEGQWRQVVNSDAKEFGGDGKFENPNIISSSNYPQISLPPHSIVFFEKIKLEEAKAAVKA